MRRREFLSVSLAGIVGVSLLWVAGAPAAKMAATTGRKARKAMVVREAATEFR
jgi:hypothetical protein